MDPVHEAWLKLALTPGLSAALAARGVDLAGGPEQACERPPAWWARLRRVEREGGPQQRPRDVVLDGVLARLEALGARALTPASPQWPRQAFQGSTDPPTALFVRGELPSAEQPRAAVVGTRAVTPYGRRVAAELAEGLARRGVCVVSGLAVGVDAAAHAGALRSGATHPATLAVLGCGLAAGYPPENRDLKEQVAERGALVSEFAPDVAPERWHFPQRNRLVAALSHAVVVVEAPERSGALITARLALDAGRAVLAVPGPIGRFSHEGSHRLLRQGSAELCRGLGDVLVALGLAAEGEGLAPREPAPPAPGPGLTLWRVLDPDEAQDPDDLCRRSGLSPSAVALALAALELDGRAVRVPGVGYLRT